MNLQQQKLSIVTQRKMIWENDIDLQQQKLSIVTQPFCDQSTILIYNSRNYLQLLNCNRKAIDRYIYNSRNYLQLLNSVLIRVRTENLQQQKLSIVTQLRISWKDYFYLQQQKLSIVTQLEVLQSIPSCIYNSRNYLQLLNKTHKSFPKGSTTVEIIYSYSTSTLISCDSLYLQQQKLSIVTQLNTFLIELHSIYNSRNYLQLLNKPQIERFALSTTVEIIYSYSTCLYLVQRI